MNMRNSWSLRNTLRHYSCHNLAFMKELQNIFCAPSQFICLWHYVRLVFILATYCLSLHFNYMSYAKLYLPNPVFLFSFWIEFHCLLFIDVDNYNFFLIVNISFCWMIFLTLNRGKTYFKYLVKACSTTVGLNFILGFSNRLKWLGV